MVLCSYQHDDSDAADKDVTYSRQNSIISTSLHNLEVCHVEVLFSEINIT